MAGTTPGHDGEIIKPLPHFSACVVKPEDDEHDHHKIANKPNAPISMIKAATVIAIGRIAL